MTSMHAPRLGEKKGLLSALRVQVRVVHALIFRETKTRFGRNPLGYFWAIADPTLHLIIWLVVLLVVKGGHRTPEHGIAPLAFLASGILPFFMFSKVNKFVANAIYANQGLLRYPIVRHFDVILARALLESCTLIMVTILMLGVMVFLGLMEGPHDLLGVFQASGLLLLLGGTYGSFNAIVTVLSPLYRSFQNVLLRIFYTSSGIFFSPENLPPAALYWLSWSPILHGVELFRASYFANYKTNFASPAYLFCWSMGLLLTMLCLEKVFREKLKE